jgi:hypothetical protein
VTYTHWRFKAKNKFYCSPNKMSKYKVKDKCCIVPLLLQKQLFSVPCQFLLIKLSLVEIISLNKNHRNIFTFSGNLILHRNLLFGIIFSILNKDLFNVYMSE